MVNNSPSQKLYEASVRIRARTLTRDPHSESVGSRPRCMERRCLSQPPSAISRDSQGLLNLNRPSGMEVRRELGLLLPFVVPRSSPPLSFPLR